MSLRVGLSRISLLRPNPVARSRLYRHLNSTANVPASVTRYLTSLKADIENTAIIHRDYPLLRWEFDQGNLQSLQSAKLLDKNEIETMLQTLALSAHPEDLSRIEQILSDMTKVFNLPPTPETHTVIIRALIQKGSFQTVKLWLEHMPKKPGGVQPTLYHHHLVLEAGPQFCSFKNMEQLVQDMRQRGCEPVDDTFKHLALARWLTTTRVSRIALPADFTPIFEDMKDTGLPYNTTVADMLSVMYLDKQRFRYAEEIMVLYNQVYSDLISPELIWENEWLLRFSSAVNDGDVVGGLRLLPKYLEEGGKPSVRLLGVFMKRISRLDRLCTVRDQLGVVPSPEQWSMVLLQCIKRGGISETMECYNRIRAEGVMPTANAVSRLIQFIATTHFDDARAAIENCIQIYKEFLTSLPDRCDQLPRETQRSLADLYSTMLKELSQLPSQQLSEEYMSMQESVFRDAEMRKIPLQSASAYLTAISMRAAHSEGEAMEAYRESKHVLDEAGYLAVLDVLSRISWSDRMEPHVPRISFYFEIVKDMKAARYSITTEVYLILLRSLGQLADRTRKSIGFLHLNGQVLAATRQTHDLILLDSTISPNSTIWNSLLDNYRLLESFPDALRVWDTMYISRTFDRDSVNIVLNTCREFGGLDMAQQIKNRLEKTGFTFDNHNWKSWITCLCEGKKMNEAIRDMCTLVKDPDPEMAYIILNRLKPEFKAKVMVAIEKHRPKLYDALLTDPELDVLRSKSN